MSSSFEHDSDVLAGICTAVIGIVGYLLSIILMVFILNTPSFRNAFGYLCISRLVSHIGIYTFNVFWAAPALILKLEESFTSSYLGARIGQISNIFWYASLYSLLQIAINRLIGVASPFLYSAFWILSIVQCILLSWEECSYVFSAAQFAWVYATTECGAFVDLYMDLVFSVVLFSVVILIDTITLFLIRKRAKELSANTNTSRRSQLAKFLVHVTFFVQGCVSAVNQAIGLASYHILLRDDATKWERLAGTTLIFQLSNIVDALIPLFFNRPFREKMKHLICDQGSDNNVFRSVAQRTLNHTTMHRRSSTK